MACDTRWRTTLPVHVQRRLASHWEHEKEEGKVWWLRKDVAKLGNELTEAIEQQTTAFSVAIQAWDRRDPNKVDDEDRAALVVFVDVKKGSWERAWSFIEAWCVRWQEIPERSGFGSRSVCESKPATVGKKGRRGRRLTRGLYRLVGAEVGPVVAR